MKKAIKDVLRSCWYRFGFQRRKATVQIGAAFARAAATAAARNLDPDIPRTWEFAGFSQHGEDGIVDYLCSKLLAPNFHFFEIGSADGLENCSAWLALARSYGGVMIEGNPYLSERAFHSLHGRIFNVQTICAMVNAENVSGLMKASPHLDPDVFIIDIDSVDYYVLKRVLELGYRPKIIVTEYNSVFGPDMAVTIPYVINLGRADRHPSRLYYGVSLAAWTKLLAQFGYHFLTVETSGTNAFYVDPATFPPGFASTILGIPFLENIGDLNGATEPFLDKEGNLVVPRRDWSKQFEMIRDMPLVNV
jgi:hypothetical protein